MGWIFIIKSFVKKISSYWLLNHHWMCWRLSKPSTHPVMIKQSLWSSLRSATYRNIGTQYRTMCGKIHHPQAPVMKKQSRWWPLSGIVLCVRPTNERRCYNVMSSLIGRVHAQNDPCSLLEWHVHMLVHNAVNLWLKQSTDIEPNNFHKQHDINRVTWMCIKSLSLTIWAVKFIFVSLTLVSTG